MQSLLNIDQRSSFELDKVQSNKILTIIVKDGDLHDACPSQLEICCILSRHQGQLQKEFLIRFPLIVIYNCNSNLGKLRSEALRTFYTFYLLLCFMRFKCKNFINSFVVLSLISRPINSLHPSNNHFLRPFLYQPQTYLTLTVEVSFPCRQTRTLKVPMLSITAAEAARKQNEVGFKLTNA